MLNRVLSSNRFRFITLISYRSQSPYQHIHRTPLIQNPSSSCTSSYLSRYFSSTNGGGGNGNGNAKDFWKIISPENDKQEDSIESVFGETSTNIDIEIASAAEEGFKDDWDFKNDDDGIVFDIVGDNTQKKLQQQQGKEKHRLLEIEEKALSQVLLKDHAFGDLIAASGITDDMLHTLMALKDFDDVPGLPPLSIIEDMRYENNTTKSTRADIERQKQHEIAASRVRQVDSLGRAYGTGKRKCSIARVWIEPGQGKFVVNDKQFDVYFPMLDQRAALLRPLSETKTLGLLDVSCSVKGGGMSGQIGAIRLGMSRALQNFAPDHFRPPLKEAGFLTRDSRIVERKKPGKAKARKSFQWVKR